VILVGLFSLSSNAQMSPPPSNEQLNLPNTFFNTLVEQDEMKKYMDRQQDRLKELEDKLNDSD